MKRPSKDRRLVIAFLLLLLVVGVVAIGRQLLSPSAPASTPLPSAAEKPPRREVLLYFAARDGRQLLPETREIHCAVETDCLRATIEALRDGPTGDLVPILPPATVLRGVVLRDNTAELDFSRELIDAHPGGSVSELFTVYGLADSLAVNFPHIRQVRILVEGNAVDTLKGHLGLLEPVKADFSFTRPAEEATAGTLPEAAAPAAAGGDRP